MQVAGKSQLVRRYSWGWWIECKACLWPYPLFYFWYLWSHDSPYTCGSDIWPHGKHLHSFSNCITSEICGYKFRFLTAGQWGFASGWKTLYITEWWMSQCRGIRCGSCSNNTLRWAAAPAWTLKSLMLLPMTTISIFLKIGIVACKGALSNSSSFLFHLLQLKPKGIFQTKIKMHRPSMNRNRFGEI